MAVEIVPTGDLVISTQRDGILEAYLGSCVGLTLRDRESGIGGLLHILLPEPTGTDIPYTPETYASTGVPRFIEAMLRQGACTQRMEACIAGGGLVGPVSDQDLLLDIGGRTTEVVEEILQYQGIKVIQAETGGMFSYRMALRLQDLETQVEPLLGQAPSSDPAPLDEPDSRDLDEAIKDVKPIPQVALKVLRMIRDQDYDMADVAYEIKQDQVISAEILNMCNKVSTGLSRKVDSIDRAIVVLGEKKLFQLVVSASLSTIMPKVPGAYSLCKGGLFQHALATAMMAHELSVFTGKCYPDVAYTAGLLHDIGKVPLDQYMAPKSPLFYRHIREAEMDLCQKEKEAVGISHTEAGEILGKNWDLPENLIDVIAHHHHPDQALVDPELVALVYLANLIISHFNSGHHLSFSSSQELEMQLKKLGLGPEQLPVVIDRIPRAVFEISLTGV